MYLETMENVIKKFQQSDSRSSFGKRHQRVALPAAGRAENKPCEAPPMSKLRGIFLARSLALRCWQFAAGSIYTVNQGGTGALGENTNSAVRSGWLRNRA